MSLGGRDPGPLPTNIYNVTYETEVGDVVKYHLSSLKIQASEHIDVKCDKYIWYYKTIFS